MNGIDTVLLAPSVFPWTALIVGLCVGSFLNVVIHRLPLMMERDWAAQCAELRGENTPVTEHYSLVSPRSRCPACGHSIKAWENVPVISWAALKGRCSACQTRISPRYPVVEILGGVAGFWAATHFGFGAAALCAMVFLWALLGLAFIDFDTQLLPDAITLPLLWAGLLVNVNGVFADLPSAVMGAAGGYLFLWLVYWGFKLATGKEGMGFGDFKLFAAIGAWTGWQLLPITIMAASIVGAIVGLVLIVLARRGKDVPMPFGPYLAAAGVVALFWGPAINRHYMALLY